MSSSRRLAAVVLTTAALLSVPTTSNAASPSAPVVTYRFSGESASFTSTAAGVTTSVFIGEYTVGDDPREREGYVSVMRNSRAASTYVSGTVDAGLIDFARNLGTASAVDIPVSITRYDWTLPYFTPPTTTQGVVTVRFEGVGPITRNASHQTLCGDGESECQSIRVDASRAATGTLTGAGLDAAGQGQIFLGRAIDAAIFRAETAPEWTPRLSQ